MDKVCEALYNIEINNAFELVTLLLIVHVWPSSFQESNRLVLSLSPIFSIFLSPSSSFLPQQKRWFPAYLPSLPTFSSLFTAPQILVIRRERIQRAFKDVDIASSRQIVSSLLPLFTSSLSKRYILIRVSFWSINFSMIICRSLW